MEAQFTDSTPMPIGKHRGKAMVNIPAPYLLWLFNAGCDHAGIRQYIQDNMESLKAEVKKIKSVPRWRP